MQSNMPTDQSRGNEYQERKFGSVHKALNAKQRNLDFMQLLKIFE